LEGSIVKVLEYLKVTNSYILSSHLNIPFLFLQVKRPKTEHSDTHERNR